MTAAGLPQLPLDFSAAAQVPVHEALRVFHPVVRAWFQGTLGEPTEPQVRGWPLIRAGHDVLIAAPTGSGKTLTAFLACLDELNGMFAFAVHDRDTGTLTLARDPIGIKPLYYWLAPDGELVFSSELASLLAHPRVPPMSAPISFS